jgi:hypothetical protein
MWSMAGTMRPISRSSRIPSLRLQPFHGRLLCRISFESRPLTPCEWSRELVIVAARTAPRLRHLIVYRQPVPDDPPRAA